MKPLKPYIDSAVKLWNTSSPSARIGIVLLLVTCSIAIAGVGYWSVQPNFVVLLSEQDGGKMDSVIDALDKEGIAYQLSGAGGNLLVDKRYYPRARMLARKSGVNAPETPEESSFLNAFSSPDERRAEALRQKQARLAETLQKFEAIDHADVLLSMPKRTPFVRDRAAPTASVVLTLREGEHISDQQATSIAKTVAFAVEGLEPEAVQISDKNGTSYTVEDEAAREISTQVEYVAYAERKLADKAQGQLLHFLGPGNASVQVSLDMSFSKGSKKIVSYQPENKVASEEDLQTETTTDNGNPSGPAGVASNLQTRRNASASSVTSKTENIKSSYLVPKTEETQSDSTPVRKYMTVSVLVNSLAEQVADESGAIAPELRAKIESVVKTAVGARETDEIVVEFLPFPEPAEVVPVETPFNWTSLNTIVEYGSLAIASIVAFVLGFLFLRRLRPTAPAPETVSSGDKLGNVRQLSKMIEQNPEVFTRLVRLWSGEDENTESDEAPAQNARAA